ncbi:hypothetical protein ACTXT7_001008 [Hymenolepis weldensis]
MKALSRRVLPLLDLNLIIPVREPSAIEHHYSLLIRIHDQSSPTPILHLISLCTPSSSSLCFINFTLIYPVVGILQEFNQV